MDGSEKIQNLPLLGAKFRSHETPAYEIHFYRDYLKRFFDLFLAVLLLPVIAPVLLVLMVLIKIDSRGPAVFNSERIGKDGKKFKCLKLRTMCLDADEKLEAILKNDEALKIEYDKYRKLKNDPRITRVGKFLRSFSLDELPQIFNVFRGEMSFVGPRPAVEDEIPKYGSLFKDYKSILPGITGMWQVNGRNNTSFDERVQLDFIYRKNLDFFLDMKILLKTLPVAVKRKGAY
jgi:Sugar transferases involved in lipopolysaccharide synthesis